ncbi:methyltransferase domain-containing protein [Pigmentiphaga soli]|uniref:Methyltransferase domain-containing protein n=1 Tax=Pigmentiphaga soli TaxID=1007095 RepID=A0ABP8GS49_9BURK
MPMPLSADQDAPIVELARWLATDPGRYALAWEQEQLDLQVGDVFGFYAMQVGLPEIDGLRANRIAFKGLVAEGLPAPAQRPRWTALAVARAEDLPFDAQSLDLLVLPHTLECSRDPHRVLREAERVLMPEGRLVITGFNPWSLWGAPPLLHWRTPFLPRGLRALSQARLRDWLELLSFDVGASRAGAYVPACRSETWLRRWAFLEHAGERWWPFAGGLYVLSAIKRTAGLRIIGPAWKTQKPARSAAAVATTRVNTHARHGRGPIA